MDDKEFLKKLRSDFYDLFSFKMREHAFDRATRGGDFYTKTDYGSKGVTLFLSNQWGGFRVEPNMFIRVDDVERLLFEFRVTVRGDTDLKKPNRVTICQNLGNIKNGLYRWWNNYNEADVEECANEIDDLVINHGLLFVENLDGRELLLSEMLASTKRKVRIGHPVDLYQKALILAGLLNREDILTNYLPIFEEYTKKGSRVGYDEFMKFRPWILGNFDLKSS